MLGICPLTPRSVKVWQTRKNWRDSHYVSVWSSYRSMEPYRETRLKLCWILHACREMKENILNIFFFSLPPVDLHFFLVISCKTLYLKWMFHMPWASFSVILFPYDLMKTRKRVEGSIFKRSVIYDILLQIWFLIEKKLKCYRLEMPELLYRQIMLLLRLVWIPYVLCNLS